MNHWNALSFQSFLMTGFCEHLHSSLRASTGQKSMRFARTIVFVSIESFQRTTCHHLFCFRFLNIKPFELPNILRPFSFFRHVPLRRPMDEYSMGNNQTPTSQSIIFAACYVQPKVTPKLTTFHRRFARLLAIYLPTLKRRSNPIANTST